MRAALYFVAACAAAVYHLAAGSPFLGFALIFCVSLYPIARWYAGATTRSERSDEGRGSQPY